MASTTAPTGPVVPTPVAVGAVDPIQARFSETVSLVRRGVENHDDSYFLRALRRTAWIRRQKPSAVKPRFLRFLHTAPLEVQESVAALFPDEEEAVMDVEEEKREDGLLLPEVELYLHHTAVHMAQTKRTCSGDVLLRSARLMMDRAKLNEGRTMDTFRARALHTFAMVFEHVRGGLDDGTRDEILAAHRSACLRLDETGQAVSINLVLRDLVSRNLVAEARKFASKARFPDRASNNQQVRHLLYMSRVEALQLEYGKSLSLVQQAIRKTPTTCGRGFRLALYQLATVVTLLTGETPERAWFSDPELGESLVAYFDLVKAVRVGHVHAFDECIRVHRERFLKDRTMTLVQRLHSSVIKTGLKAIGAAYSRIPFQDIALKLELAEQEDDGQAALYLCAKAIRDGVLDATIDSEHKALCSSSALDVYSSTSDPQKSYQRRINFLLQVHNDAVKSLRFPPDAHKTTNRPKALEPEETDLDELDEQMAEGDD